MDIEKEIEVDNDFVGDNIIKVDSNDTEQIEKIISCVYDTVNNNIKVVYLVENLNEEDPSHLHIKIEISLEIGNHL